MVENSIHRIRELAKERVTEGETGVTSLVKGLLCRYRGNSTGEVKKWFMQLSPQEKDKLLIFTAALVAQRRKEKGLKLNYLEAVAYLSRILGIKPRHS